VWVYHFRARLVIDKAKRVELGGVASFPRGLQVECSNTLRRYAKAQT
jgi:hypothetical protein